MLTFNGHGVKLLAKSLSALKLFYVGYGGLSRRFFSIDSCTKVSCDGNNSSFADYNAHAITEFNLVICKLALGTKSNVEWSAH